MLRPDQFTSGFPKDASGSIFFTSFRERQSAILIVQTEGLQRAVHLDEQAGFHCFDRSIRHRLEGAFVPDVVFELDHKTIYDPYRHGETLGSLVRRESELHIVVQYSDADGSWDNASIPVLENLPEAEDSRDIGFTEWRLVVGEGDDKRELYRRTAPPVGQ